MYTSLTWPISTYFDWRSGLIAATCSGFKFKVLAAVSNRSVANFIMSALLNCAQTAGAVNKNIAKVNFPRIMVSPSKLRRTPTLGWMQFLHNWFKLSKTRATVSTTTASGSSQRVCALPSPLLQGPNPTPFPQFPQKARERNFSGILTPAALARPCKTLVDEQCLPTGRSLRRVGYRKVFGSFAAIFSSRAQAAAESLHDRHGKS